MQAARKGTFAAMGGADGFDSDEEVQNKKTKTQVKKEKNQIAEQATVAPLKKMTNAQREKTVSDGFAVVDQGRPQTAQPRGGRGGDRGGRGRGGDRPQTGRGGGERGRGGRGGERGRGGRGGRGGDRGGRGGDGEGRGQLFRGAPRKRPVDGGPENEPRGRLNADGENRDPDQRPPRRPRNEGGEGPHGGYDRKDASGRGRRGNKQGGKFGEGDQVERTYKQKGAEASASTEPAEETKEEKGPAEDEVEVIYGVSFDDYFNTNPLTGKKESRASQGVTKDTKVEANTKEKTHE